MPVDRSREVKGIGEKHLKFYFSFHFTAVVDCGPPPYIPNALSAPVDKTTYGNQVLYTCQPNYVLESGNSTAVCNAKGKWEGADMVCKGKENI